jgi:hypothetical protein
MGTEPVDCGVKKRFPCGHLGKGQFCHGCAQDQHADEVRPDDSAEARAWKATFEADVIDLHAIRQYRLMEKARVIIAAMTAGAAHTEFRGKRLQGQPCGYLDPGGTELSFALPGRRGGPETAVSGEPRAVQHRSSAGGVAGDHIAHWTEDN